MVGSTVVTLIGRLVRGGGAIVPGCWRVGLMTWAHSHGAVTATADGPLWPPLCWFGGRNASVGQQ